MKCKLCLEEKQLIKKSHIIPDFLYKDIFDEDHFLYKIAVNEPSLHRRYPTGPYDRYMLCSKCDNERLSFLENYASKILYGGNGLTNSLKFERLDSLRMIGSKIDYSSFKLFLLSILWRGHHSQQSFFKNIELGIYEERIRSMILNNDAGDDSEFEICIIYHKDLPFNTVIKPRKIKDKGNTCYLMHLNKMSIWYNVSSYNKLDFFNDVGLRSDNTMTFYVLSGEISKMVLNKSTGIPFGLLK